MYNILIDSSYYIIFSMAFTYIWKWLISKIKTTNYVDIGEVLCLCVGSVKYLQIHMWNPNVTETCTTRNTAENWVNSWRL